VLGACRPRPPLVVGALLCVCVVDQIAAHRSLPLVSPCPPVTDGHLHPAPIRRGAPSRGRPRECQPADTSGVGRIEIETRSDAERRVGGGRTVPRVVARCPGRRSGAPPRAASDVEVTGRNDHRAAP
jgi:hypothetical protein